MDLFWRYALLVVLGLLCLVLAVLKSLGIYPRPAACDLSQRIGGPLIVVEGTVTELPLTRWGRTRFRVEAATQDHAHRGHLLVTTHFPADVALGDRLELRGYLSAFRQARSGTRLSDADYWASRATFCQLTVWQPSGLRKCVGGSAFAQLAYRYRQRFFAFWNDRLETDRAALLLGVTMGGRGVLPPSLKESCIRAGVYHIVVVSGQNMSLIIAVVLFLISLTPAPPRRALFICAPPILFYTLAVGADPPVVRAAASALVRLIARALRRDIPAIYPLAWAAIWVILRDPTDFFGASFQLSFGASLALYFLFSYWPSLRKGRGWRWWLLESGAMSLAVHIGIGPLLMFYFHRVSLVGFFANWTLFPLAGLLMVGGLIIGSIGAYWPEWVPRAVTEGVDLLAAGTLKVISWMGNWRWTTVEVSPPPPAFLFAYTLTLFGILLVIHRRRIHAQAFPQPTRRNRL